MQVLVGCGGREGGEGGEGCYYSYIHDVGENCKLIGKYFLFTIKIYLTDIWADFSRRSNSKY